MTPFFDFSSFVTRMPWVQKRRKAQVALTFSGHVLKPSLVRDLTCGTSVKSRHYRMTWRFPEFSDYWKRMEHAVEDF